MANLKIMQAPLKTALQQICLVADNQPTIPALAYVFLIATPKQTRLYANNYDQHLTLYLNNCSGRLEIGLHANQFLRAVSKFKPTDEITIWATGTDKPVVTVESGNKSFTLDNHFDVFDERLQEGILIPNENPKMFTLAAKEWLTALNTVKHCISTEETRYYLNGIFVNNYKGKLTFTATNGHIMALYQFVTHKIKKQSINAIIPREAIRQLLTVLKNKGDVNLEIFDKHAKFSNQHFSFSTKLIDGSYPDYQKILDTAPDTNVMATIATKDVLAVAKDFASIPSTGSASIIINCSEQNKMSFSNKSEDLNMNMWLKAKTTVFKESIGMNAFNLVKTVKSFTELDKANPNPDLVFYRHDDTVSPLLIAAKNSSHFLNIIMPMRY